MKVSCAKPKGFQPVKIVLETQKEVDYLVALLGATSLAVDRVLGCDGTAMYNALDKYSANELSHLVGIEVN